MISLYIVEDEKISRESIKKNIAWEEYGIKLLGDAPDGDIALPEILEKKPDILLTDIKMPFMDGLELSKLVKKKQPSIKIILLSGYNEFDYARQAISIGINEYLLKPVSSADILNSVNKVKQEIETLRQNKMEQEQRQTFHQDTMHQLFFNGLFSGYLSSASQIIEHAEQLGISLYSHIYQVLILHIEIDKGLLRAEEQRIFLTPPISVLPFCLLSEEIAYILQSDDREQLVYLRNDLENWIIKQAALQNLRIKLKWGAAVSRVTDICKSYQSANVSRLHLGEEESSQFSISIAFKGEDLLEFLRTGKISMIESFWLNYNLAVDRALSSLIYRSYLYTEVFFVSNQFAKEIGIDLPASLTKFEKIENIAIENDTIENFNKFVYDLCSQLMNQRDELNKGHSPHISLKAKSYIEKNYADPDLSLGKVAGAIHISPNYLSTLFKEKIGQNFSEYLADVRIRQAEKLLVTTDLSVTEIASRVGYQNINYFSMIFKKITNMSPSKYQDRKIQP